ncbi:transcriptional regulator family: Fungal Specific TF [Paecilomyces variotii]|nr:transcriptional regulator family: Fungal Specific TF [Paecilomyces variotii]KAJ9207761.1 transcriptional regulator family: Fungal Specific TF [Paecilomyces variotii]KAJ9245962.1 transcriptional regulator family: Fungal Specific TF [Paecilomyces variotii]KAJ9246361.1 transcriptional regulator family: Fungal Specific TF [Paecilomyces variotii]KAJ9280688.1 transcriptional regulator family: Fungal Specific TF [Paecilomyces variotii]
MERHHSHDSSCSIQAPKERRAKRRKVALACVECRTRKVRCDGAHPVCGACIKRARQCVYTLDLERKRSIEREYVLRLESRVRELERERASLRTLSASETRVPASDGWEHSGVNVHFRASQHSPRGGSVATVPTSRDTPRIFSYRSDQNGDDGSEPWGLKSKDNRYSDVTNTSLHFNGKPSRGEEMSDGVNAMMGAVEERPTQGFFGSSSAASFMKQVKSAVEEKVSSPESKPSDSVGENPPRSTLMSRRKNNIESELATYALPPRKFADGLMDVYWNLVFPLYPFVDRAQLNAQYNNIWTGESSEYDENMLMCTFNTIFALSCQLSDSIEPRERRASADVFFSRAKELLQFNLWNSGSAELIQCLLLMGQYLQSTDSAHQCWIVIGLAVRNAQSLGLHLPSTISRFESLQEQRLARIIWYGCVLMDRVVSMTFGRPTMISEPSYSWVSLPATIDDDESTSPSGRDGPGKRADEPSLINFFERSLELYEILNVILVRLYSSNPEGRLNDGRSYYCSQKESSDGEREVFELDRALAEWCRRLPPHLRDGESAANPIFQRQSIVLRSRFLHVRMLLFRPSLSRYCTNRDSSCEDPLISLSGSFPQRVTLQCSIICVRAAQELIELIYNKVPSDGTNGPLPAWWYNILYVYTAATVLIAGRLRSAIVAEITEPTVTRSWNLALEILRKYQESSTSARRCIAALEILYDRVVSEGQEPRHRVTSTLSSEQQSQSFPLLPAPNSLDEIYLGEGIDSTVFETFNLADPQDMSWLHSVPSNLY